VLGGCEGGLLTVLEGLGYSCVPCAQVLSVAGLCDIPSLFPLGRGVILEVIYLPDYLGFERFLPLISVIPAVVRVDLLVQPDSL